jgi:predicted phosphatase
MLSGTQPSKLNEQCFDIGNMARRRHLDAIEVPNTFIVNIHPHTWQKKMLQMLMVGLNTNKEGGQTIIRNVQEQFTLTIDKKQPKIWVVLH